MIEIRCKPKMQPASAVEVGKAVWRISLQVFYLPMDLLYPGRRGQNNPFLPREKTQLIDLKSWNQKSWVLFWSWETTAPPKRKTHKKKKHVHDAQHLHIITLDAMSIHIIFAAFFRGSHGSPYPTRPGEHVGRWLCCLRQGSQCVKGRSVHGLRLRSRLLSTGSMSCYKKTTVFSGVWWASMSNIVFRGKDVWLIFT